MMKLFKIYSGGEPVYFNNKAEAKVARNVVNGSILPGKCKVMRGPDHWRGETFD